MRRLFSVAGVRLPTSPRLGRRSNLCARSSTVRTAATSTMADAGATTLASSVNGAADRVAYLKRAEQVLA
jgi:hypothetical protein